MVHRICTTTQFGHNCGPGYDPSGQADISEQLSLADAAALFDPASACAREDDGLVYNQGLHIAGVFIIFSASMIGVGAPVLGKYIPFCAVHPYLLVLGKCAGIGIILACALVHLLQPGNDELTNSCLSSEFTTDYNAYAYLFCMLAIIMMQFIEFMVDDYVTGRLREQASSESFLENDHALPPPEGKVGLDSATERILDSGNPPARHTNKPLIGVITESYQAGGSYDRAGHLHTGAENGKDAGHTLPSSATLADADLRCNDLSKQHYHHDRISHEHEARGSGHSHSVLHMKGIKRTIAAYLLEFSVTVHSIFIGLTTGIVGQNQFKALIVALVFHQMFEGVALGARIAEAEFGTRSEEAAMILVFALSAPLGMAIGIGVASINPNGATYNYAAGTLNSVCAGILIYIGMLLMLRGFPGGFAHALRKE